MLDIRSAAEEGTDGHPNGGSSAMPGQGCSDFKDNAKPESTTQADAIDTKQNRIWKDQDEVINKKSD